MGFFKEGLLVSARDFINSSLKVGLVQGETPVLIVYHGDGDGCCAGYFLKKYLSCPTEFYWVATPDFDFIKAQSYITKRNKPLTIFLDMPVYNRPEMIEELSTRKHVLIYDHHYPGTCDVCKGKETVFYLNPVIHQNGMEFPTALFGWELLEEKGRFEKEILFAALFTETWLERVSLFSDLSLPHQDRLRQIARRVQSSFLIQDMSTTHYALDFLTMASLEGCLSATQLEAQEEYKILEAIYQLIQNEKSWLMRRVTAQIKRFPNPKFILKKTESKMRICGLMASELRWHYPALVVGVWQRWKRRYYCELRRGRDCGENLASLVERVKSEVELITGGGHPAAAAFSAEGDNFFKALDRLRYHLTGESPQMSKSYEG
jgi:hypothetical protein